MTAPAPSTMALARRCLTCSHDAGTSLFRQRFARIEGASILDGYEVVSCARCGGCFADGIPEQAVFDAYYRDMSKYENAERDGRVSPHDQARFEAEARDLAAHLPSLDAEIFEIGCSTGGLLAVLRTMGYRSLLGLDPSAACARAAKRDHGIEVVTGSMFGGAQGGRTFDAVLLVGVLEHLADVSTALTAVRAMLRPDGVAFIEVPDAMEFRRYGDAAFQQFSVEHLNYFSVATLDALMAAHGFATVRSMQNVRGHVGGGADPVVTGIYRPGPTRAPDRERVTAAAIADYVAESETRERALRDAVDRIVAANRPLVVWGCGTLTLRLLATTSLGNARITAFVDSNPRYHGKRIGAVPVVQPRDVVGMKEPILISTLGYQRQIEAQIRALGCANEVLTFPAPAAGGGSAP